MLFTRIVLFLLLHFIALTTFAQKLTSSPYSQYGIGEIVRPAFSSQSATGLSNAVIDPSYINVSNPASYGWHDLTVFETGARSNNTYRTAPDSTWWINNTSFGYLALAFPITKWWGTSFGVLPYSAAGYNVTSTDSGANVGKVVYSNKGEGNINRAYIGNGFKKEFIQLRYINILATEEADFIEIISQDDSLTKVTINRVSEKGIKTVISQRNIKRGESNEVRVYGLGGNDSIVISGNAEKAIELRVFPGAGDDKVYDQSSEKRKEKIYIYNSDSLFKEEVLVKSSRTRIISEKGLTISSPQTVFEYNYTGLSLGFNANYLFGSILRDNRTVFSSTPYHSRLIQRLNMHDITFDAGALYSQRISENLKVNVGLTYGISDDLKATRSTLGFTYENISENEVGKDTLIYSEDTGSITLPQKIGIGLSLVKTDKWQVGVDYTIHKWSQLKIFEADQGLIDNSFLNLGLQFTPERNAAGRFMRTLNYRAGAFYMPGFISVNNTVINEYGLSLGVGIPLRRSRSSLNFAVQAGERGTRKSNLTKEQFVNFTLGISINDKWFIKRKYE